MNEREALICLRALAFKVVLKDDRPLIAPHPDGKVPPEELVGILRANHDAVVSILRAEKERGVLKTSAWPRRA